MSKTFWLARPLYLNEFFPKRLPFSAVITGMFRDFRINDEFDFTHSQSNCGATGIASTDNEVTFASNLGSAPGAIFGAAAASFLGEAFAAVFGEAFAAVLGEAFAAVFGDASA